MSRNKIKWNQFRKKSNKITVKKNYNQDLHNYLLKVSTYFCILLKDKNLKKLNLNFPYLIRQTKLYYYGNQLKSLLSSFFSGGFLFSLVFKQKFKKKFNDFKSTF